jgi:signal transduction histidine kinase
MTARLTAEHTEAARFSESVRSGRAASAWPGVARIRAWSRRHTLLSDVLTVAVFVAVIGISRPDGRVPSHLPSLALDVALVIPLAWRRRYPLLVFAAVSAVAALQWWAARPVFADLALLIALYTVASRFPRKHALAAAVVLEAGVAAAVVKWSPPQGMFAGFVFLSGMAIAAFVLGVNIQTRRAYLASLEDRTIRAERERDQRSQIDAAKERALIAREMHDIVAHNLSVMIALADGAAFAARANAADAEAAARHVSATGRQALDEMHRLLGVLRGNGDETPRAPQPGIAQIDELVTQVRVAGLPTSWTVAGQPFPLSPTAGLAVYRVVQEALTNVLKHADEPTEAKVSLRYADPVVELEIIDDGRGRPAPPGAVAGHGLSGMRERVAVFDGRVAAGARPGGGWRVWARLDSGRLGAEVSP